MKNKKLIREQFRTAVFMRDNNKCRKCGANGDIYKLDAHHVISRKNPSLNGGYIKENGISLCEDCHLKAEEFHSTGRCDQGWHPDDLYRLIGSSYEQAIIASKKLK